MIVRKHIVTVRYFDYGYPLDTVYRTATSVGGGRAVSDEPEYRSRSEALAARDKWLSEHSGAQPDWLILESGNDIERCCDMNPHGLI